MTPHEVSPRLKLERFASIVAAVLLMLPAIGNAQFIYTINDGTVTITGGCPSAPGDLTIPDTIDGLPVTSISRYAFGSCANLTNVVISTSVTNIEVFAFEKCRNLTAIEVSSANATYSSLSGVLFDKEQTVLLSCPGGKSGVYVIPTSVTNIGNNAFAYCSSLTSVTIPNKVTTIGGEAFRNCRSLTNVSLTNNLTFIGERAFYECAQLTSVRIPDSLAWITPEVFEDCGSLATVVLGNGVTSIEYGAFSGCPRLTNITLPDSLKSVGSFTFAYCSRLASVKIPTNLNYIAFEMFTGCSSLTSVMIPESVRGIQERAFSSCGLVTITIPKSVTSIRDKVFFDCTKLKGVYFQGNGVGLGRDDLTIGSDLFAGDNNVTVYFLSGSRGWGSTFSGRPTARWTNPLLSIPTATASASDLAFTISWAPNATLVVEASPNLANPAWSPIGTNTPASGSWQFTDPNWANQPHRFYRVRLP